MKAHVICCNDSVKAVVLGDEEKAKEHMEDLSKGYYKKYGPRYWYSSYKQYLQQNKWHIHTVDAVLMN
jgi:hypothetical protein